MLKTIFNIVLCISIAQLIYTKTLPVLQPDLELPPQLEFNDEYQLEAERIFEEMETDFEVLPPPPPIELPASMPSLIGGIANNVRLLAPGRKLPLLFVFQWPIVFAKENPAKANTHKINAHRNWTIHGLWPNGATNCDKKYRFIESEVAHIKHELEKAWPNFAHFKGPKAQEDSSFWKYQWEKHGTCSEMRLKDYFTKANDLFKKYPLGEWLYQSRINPKDHYEYNQGNFTTAFHNFKVGPKQYVLKCVKGNWLKEIYLCFDYKGKLINCPSSVKNTCPAKFYYLDKI